MKPSSVLTSALVATCSSFLLASPLVSAATAEEWKTRNIYQLLTDRFAPPSDAAPALTGGAGDCTIGSQTWCGGTWRSIMTKLDYIQGMGIDAIWISPTSQNLDVATPYGFAYHGYWVNDPTRLNARFGTSEDLKALSDELHRRGMYLMVDVAVNSVVSLSIDVTTNQLEADEGLLWTESDEFHPYCEIDYSNSTSVEQCWLGDTHLPLMDVNTENKKVEATLQAWIADFVSTYGVDGLRIDAAKHVVPTFWPGFCKAANVFCIGEVYTADIHYGATFQTENYMDSILNVSSRRVLLLHLLLVFPHGSRDSYLTPAKKTDTLPFSISPSLPVPNVHRYPERIYTSWSPEHVLAR